MSQSVLPLVYTGSFKALSFFLFEVLNTSENYKIDDYLNKIIL